MANITSSELLALDTTDLAVAPYKLAGSDNESLRPKYIVSGDLLKSVVIDDKWRAPVMTGLTGRDLTKVEEFFVSVGAGAGDVVEKYVPGLKSYGGGVETTLSSAGDTVLNSLNEENIGAILGVLKGREYPSEKWARRLMANAGDEAAVIELNRAIYNRQHGIDSDAFSNKAANGLGSIIPALVVGLGSMATGTAFLGIPLLFGQFAGEYSLGTIDEYRQRTGDLNLDNFTAQDARVASAATYAAINTAASMMGAEGILKAALTKAGLTSGVIPQTTKRVLVGGIPEGLSEVIDPISEQLLRKADGTSTKTWEEVIQEALVGGAVGFLTGGVIGGAAYHVARANLRRAIKSNFPRLSDANVAQVADTMLDMTGELSLKDKALYNNLHEKIEAIYSESDMDSQTINALTDLEYAVIVADANERGIDLASHPLFAGEVNELGWFRDGIPEARRAEIEGYAKEIRDLRAELKTLNEAKEKDWAKIEEVEAKLEAAIDLIPERISGLVVADRAQMAQMLTEQRDLIARKNALRKVQQRARIAAAREAEKEERISERERQRQERKEAQAAESDRRQAVRNLTRKIKEDADLKLQKAKAEIPLATKESLQAVLLKAGFDRAVVAQMGIRTLRSQVRQLKNADLSLLKRDPELVKQKKIAKVPNIMENQGEIDAIEELGYQTLRDAGYSNRQIAKMSQAEMLKVLRKELLADEAATVYNQADNIVDLTEEVGSNPSVEQITEYLNSLVGKILETGSKPLQVQVKGRHVRHIAKSNVPLSKSNEKKHNAAVRQLDKILKTAIKTNRDGSVDLSHNTNPKTLARKKNIVQYVYFEAPVKIGENIYTVEFSTEQLKNQDPNLLDLYNVRVKKTGVRATEKGTSTPASTTSIDKSKLNVKPEYQEGRSGRKPRGAYVAEYRFIAKTRNMDESTVAHELAHDWIEQYFRYAQSGKASKEYMKRWAVLSKALGIKEGDIRVSSEASEKFARAYEGWLLKKDWDKALNVADDEKRRLIEEFKRYQQSLRDIYSGLTDKYFKQTWGKTGELDPRIQAWFEKIGDIDVEELEASREPMTPAQESQRAVDKAIDIVIDNSTDPETKKRLTAAKLLNDTSRYEVKGGNKNSLQRRLSALAKDIDQDGVMVNENYDTHRDMMAVAEAADNFVKTRQQEAIDIINGVKPETDGLYASDLYTALERVAIETGDLDLLNELRGSKVANSLAKELGQRVAGFRNYKQAGIDYVQTVKALDRKYAEAAGKEKGKAQIAEATALLKEAQAEQDARDTKTLDSLLDMLKCK